MSDDPPPGHLRYHEIDIPAKFIRDAMAHVEHTQVRYVTFIFTGEMTDDAICAGVTTRLMLTHQPQTIGARPEVRPAGRPAGRTASPTVLAVTNEVVLDVIANHGPITTKKIGDALEIAGNDGQARQKIRRVLNDLTRGRMVRRTGSNRYPSFVLVGDAGAKMPLRTGKARQVTRNHITEDVVMEQLRAAGQTTSRAIGDALNIPRPDTFVRSKITEIVGKLVKQNRLKIITGHPQGGRVYGLVDEASAAAATS